MGLFNGGQWGKISVCTCLRARSINEEVFALIRAKNWGWVSGPLSSTCHFIPFFILYIMGSCSFWKGAKFQDSRIGDICTQKKLKIVTPMVFNAMGLFPENSDNHRGDYKYLWAVFVSHKKIPRLCPNYGISKHFIRNFGEFCCRLILWPNLERNSWNWILNIWPLDNI